MSVDEWKIRISLLHCIISLTKYYSLLSMAQQQRDGFLSSTLGYSFRNKEGYSNILSKVGKIRERLSSSSYGTVLRKAEVKTAFLIS